MAKLNWQLQKRAMVKYARSHGVDVPDGFRADTNRCGHACRILIVRVKRRMGIKPATDRFTFELWQRLGPYRVRKLTWRARVKLQLHAAILHEPAWHYLQVRAYQLRWVPGMVCRTDCSGGASLMHKQGGGQDPSGYGFNGYGNSETIYQHLRSRRITAREALPGDLVYWPGHVCVVYQHGADPVLWSHGQEAGPILIYASVEDRYHSGSPVYMRARRR